MLDTRSLQKHNDNGVLYLTGPKMEQLPGIKHLFSTRHGGVSQGCYSEMNLSFTRGDEEAAVSENYRRIAGCLGTTPDRIVCTYQTHTSNIRKVTIDDAGKGVTRPKDYVDVDGLVTDIPGLALGCYVADCVPVLLADPVKKVVAVLHAGWRGTAGKIAAKGVKMFTEEYGSNLSDIHAVIGPSICRNCYEVGQEVMDAMRSAVAPEHYELIYSPRKKEGKYQLDLWETNRWILVEAGVSPETIEVTDLCTCCHPKDLFSHRVTGEKRGNLGAFIMIAE